MKDLKQGQVAFVQPSIYCPTGCGHQMSVIEFENDIPDPRYPPSSGLTMTLILWQCPYCKDHDIEAERTAYWSDLEIETGDYSWSGK